MSNYLSKSFDHKVFWENRKYRNNNPLEQVTITLDVPCPSYICFVFALVSSFPVKLIKGQSKFIGCSGKNERAILLVSWKWLLRLAEAGIKWDVLEVGMIHREYEYEWIERAVTFTPISVQYKWKGKYASQNLTFQNTLFYRLYFEENLYLRIFY